jgi:hypothetical protein
MPPRSMAPARLKNQRPLNIDVHLSPLPHPMATHRHRSLASHRSIPPRDTSPPEPLSSAPAPDHLDTVEALVRDAVSWGLKEDVTRRVITLHKDLEKCRRILTDAAERNKRQVA